MPDGAEDADGDGIPNAVEQDMGLNPTVAVSRPDGVPDGDRASKLPGMTVTEAVDQGYDPAKAEPTLLPTVAINPMDPPPVPLIVPGDPGPVPTPGQDAPTLTDPAQTTTTTTPTPADPAPVAAAPVDPTPVAPAPVAPAPVDPTPPADPAPVSGEPPSSSTGASDPPAAAHATGSTG